MCARVSLDELLETKHVSVHVSIYAYSDLEKLTIIFCAPRRWKGENVSTSEVEIVASKLINFKDCAVYGVQVGNLEGRAGMLAIADPKGEVDLEALAKGLDEELPVYARPLFIRIVTKLAVTGEPSSTVGATLKFFYIDRVRYLIFSFLFRRYL